MKEAPEADSADRIATLQAQLAQALAFLGHEAREGHSSTLALLELRRVRREPMSIEELVERVEGNARRSLAVIDGFVDLACARTQALRVEEFDLLDLSVEAVAELHSLAQRRGVALQMAERTAAASCWADRELVSRALNGILQEMVGAAAAGTRIDCALIDEPRGWCFEAQESVVPAHTDGVARGLAQVEVPALGVQLAAAVAERHAGALRTSTTPAHGRVVRFSLPTRGESGASTAT